MLNALVVRVFQNSEAPKGVRSATVGVLGAPKGVGLCHGRCEGMPPKVCGSNGVAVRGRGVLEQNYGNGGNGGQSG